MKVPTYIEEYCYGGKCNLILYTMRKGEKTRRKQGEKHKK